MAVIIVERTFDNPPTDAEMHEVAERERPCKEMYGVTWIRSLLSSDRRRMICEYDAPDAQAVRKVQQEAGAPFDQVWPAKVID